MPQGSGFLNTAPSPIPGGYGNPAGANFGLPTAAPGSGIPSAGALSTSLTSSTQKQLPNSLFPANTGGSTGVPVGLQGLSSGFNTGTDPKMLTSLYNYLGKAYGKGPGTLLGQLLTQGMFNPQVAQALMNAMEPTISRGYNDVLSAFGSAGARFSSAASIGAGDYMSQARLGQTAQLAQLFENAQNQQLGLLENVLPTIHQERADEGGLFSKILGGLEAVGGIIGAPFTGGASLALTGAGLGMLGGGGGGGGSQVAGLSSLSSLFNSGQSAFPNMTPTAISAGYGGPGQVPLTSSSLTDLLLSQSAGESLGMPASSGNSIPGIMY